MEPHRCLHHARKNGSLRSQIYTRFVHCERDPPIYYCVCYRKQIIAALKARYPDVPIIAFPREAGNNYIGFAKATGADCVAVDNSVSPEWVAEHVQIHGCVQGNLKSSHMVSGGQALIDETRHVVAALSKGPHIFNLGHGITPDADPENVQIMIDTVRGS